MPCDHGQELSALHLCDCVGDGLRRDETHVQEAEGAFVGTHVPELSGWWSQNTTTVVKHYSRVSETPCFPGETSREISANLSGVIRAIRFARFARIGVIRANRKFE